MVPKHYICTITKIKQETPTVKTLRLELPENEKIEFIPGQFVIVSLINVDSSLLKIKRSYSISSQPSNQDYIDVTFDSHGPFTQTMFKLKENDKINIFGPYGKFILNLDAYKKIALFGGGTGIAPLMSMVRFITDNGFNNDVVLLYSVKKPDEVVFNDELIERNKNFPNFRFIPTITRLDGGHWEGQKGRISSDMIKKFIPDIDKYTSYICGSPDFTRSMVLMLNNLHVLDENIKKEAW